jgi:hypothetical protein
MLGRAIEQEALATKIRSYWLPGEAAEIGATASEGEVSAALSSWEREHFGVGGEARMARYLSERGLTLTDEREALRAQVLSTNLNKALVQFGGKSAIARFESTVLPKWTAKTVCQADYAVEACRNYRQSPSTSPAQLLARLSGQG